MPVKREVPRVVVRFRWGCEEAPAGMGAGSGGGQFASPTLSSGAHSTEWGLQAGEDYKCLGQDLDPDLKPAFRA